MRWGGLEWLRSISLTADVRQHAGEQRVGGDVEGDSQAHVGGALVEAAGEGAISHVELEGGEGGRDERGSELRYGRCMGKMGIERAQNERGEGGGGEGGRKELREGEGDGRGE